MTLQIAKPQAFLTSLVGIDPAVARHVSHDRVLQRLRYSPGRTLTESAVELEQAWAEARLGLMGRSLSSGIVQGLRVSVPDQSIVAGRFVLGAGRGIAPEGQDIEVHADATLDLPDLPKAGGAGAIGDPPEGPVVVVLEPIVVEKEDLPQGEHSDAAFRDQCPPDATIAPYLDFVLQDAARIAWVQLDTAILGPDPALAPNVAAEALRQLELADPSALPWADFGLPVVLLNVNASGQIRWHHRAAVARRGGMLPRAALSNVASLRQSRLDGLVEETSRASRIGGWGGGNAAVFLRHLPPAGLLPRKAWDSGAFFPAGYRQAQAPIPLDQLDATLEASAAMAPYDLTVAEDVVKWLVPVPTHVYEPDLLVPVEEPDFSAVEALLETRVANALSLRDGYRGQGEVVEGLLDIGAVTTFATDEDEIPGEAGFATDSPETPEDLAGSAEAELTEFFTALPADTLTPEQRDLVDPAVRPSGPSEFGLTPFITRLRADIDKAHDVIDFSYSRVQAEIYRLRQIMLDNEEATKLATYPVLAGLAKGSNSYALSEGLKTHFVGAPRDGGGGGGGGGARASDTQMVVANQVRFQPSVMSVPHADMSLAVPDSARAPGIAPATTKVGTESLISFTAADVSFGFGKIFTDASLAAAETTLTTTFKDIVDSTRSELVDDLVLADSQSKRLGILRAYPLPGDIRDTRTVTVADRLKGSAALTAKASSVRIKADVLREMLALGISLVGLRAPLTSGPDVAFLLRDDVEEIVSGFSLTTEEQTTLEGLIADVLTSEGRTFQLVSLPPPPAPTGDTPLSTLDVLLNQLRQARAPLDIAELPSLTLSKALDPDPVADGGAANAGDDESAFLTSAVGTLENAVAILRVVEARIAALTNILADAEARLIPLRDFLERWESALAAADQDLDEARHDLLVGRSLIQEERDRLAAVQERRTKVIEEHVKYVAYTRPRVLRNHAQGDTPGLLLPGTFEDPLPDSLREDVDAPEQLADMIDALREVPIGWFSSNPELAAKFKRPKYLDHVYAGVISRATKRIAQLQALPVYQPVAPRRNAPAYAASIKLASAYRSMALNLLAARQALDVPSFNRASWHDRQRRALEDLSLNDLIESGSQPAVAKRALLEVEQIERVASSLLQLFRRVNPALRLLWAQDLSVFDDGFSLKNLSRLKGWHTVEFSLRRKMLRLNTWLFGRMTEGVKEAEAVMSDIVRVAILLSSYAPVAEIVSARLDQEQSAKPGGAVEITIRRGVPLIGMQVAFAEAGLTQVRGVLRDVYQDRAKVEITSVASGITAIGTSTHVSLHTGLGRSLIAR